MTYNLRQPLNLLNNGSMNLPFLIMTRDLSSTIVIQAIKRHNFDHHNKRPGSYKEEENSLKARPVSENGTCLI